MRNMIPPANLVIWSEHPYRMRDNGSSYVQPLPRPDLNVERLFDHIGNIGSKEREDRIYYCTGIPLTNAYHKHGYDCIPGAPFNIPA